MAQERKKTRIVLASILKPVDDTRMFEKMGMSLSNSGLYDVFVVGFPSVSKRVFPGIQQISLQSFPRLSMQRAWAKWEVLRIILRLKPDVVIFNTHELILPSILAKILVADLAIVYDIRENYYRNILHAGSFSRLLRWPLAWYVRFKEKLLAPAVNHFLLAERAYEQEIKFHRSGWTVLENKATLLPEVPPVHKHEPGKIRLLFSGTLAESTGVYKAIQIARELNRLDASVSLTIMGHAAAKAVRENILEEVKHNNFIQLIGGENLVPHSEILNCIQQSDAGILIYPRSPHTMNSHPTKLYEYLHAQLPIILDREWPWTNEYEAADPFILINMVQPNYPALLNDLKTKAFYPTAPVNVTWASEEPRLLNALRNL